MWRYVKSASKILTRYQRSSSSHDILSVEFHHRARFPALCDCVHVHTNDCHSGIEEQAVVTRLARLFCLCLDTVSSRHNGRKSAVYV